ncbi:uncharacterized protein MYCFIDRAFT_171938 [Pseudocercospora fijiensis CIRAD86]|uniref:Uncharacterized protein n=1 Tax=Pseudocercospora fijiensis (strain CIRAD86) TaxID=383855 RepID=M3BA54_PSEFD|nr:uncharacterized protein MYCFIDRAFT_171938 [Pseudocercospora fijiensis CIRAD86]EME86138.1 hypothetical protein MYCFIDRAFT_171938 [Pseudocercospora fijiensis CIRAD86]
MLNIPRYYDQGIIILGCVHLEGTKLREMHSARRPSDWAEFNSRNSLSVAAEPAMQQRKLITIFIASS